MRRLIRSALVPVGGALAGLAILAQGAQSVHGGNARESVPETLHPATKPAAEEENGSIPCR